jgi:hypothetical protein
MVFMRSVLLAVLASAAADPGADTGSPPPPPQLDDGPFGSFESSSLADEATSNAVLLFSEDPAVTSDGGWFLSLFAVSFFSDPPTTQASTSSSGEVLRWRCLDEMTDITAPARKPDNVGEIPGVLQLPLFEDANLTASIDFWRYNYDQSISWVGTLTGEVGGSVFITVVDGKTSAAIREAGRYWRVRPDPVCGHLVEEFDAYAPIDNEDEDIDVEPLQGSSHPPGAPSGETDFIDILYIYSELARTYLGGDVAIPHDDAGVRGWANNQVLELDRILARSRSRTHIPRLVGILPDVGGSLVDPGPTWQVSDCCNPQCDTDDPNCNACDTGPITLTCPIGESIAAISVDTFVAQARDLYGADLVQGVLSRGYEVAGAERGSPPTQPQPGTTVEGFSVSNIVGAAVWTPQHEMGHSFGINHKCISSPCNPLVDGFGGLASGFVASVDNPQAGMADFSYGDLMSRSVACRLPVFSRPPRYPAAAGGFVSDGFGYSPISLGAPCDARENSSRYGDDIFQIGVEPLAQSPGGVGRNGVRLGIVPNDIELTTVFPVADAAIFMVSTIFTDPANNEEWTPLEIVANYRPEDGVPLYPPIFMSLDPSDGTLARPFDAAMTFQWELSPFAATMLVPGAGNPYDPLVADTSPYFVEIAVNAGDPPFYESYVAPSSCPGAGLPCALSLTMPNPSLTYHGKLWTQHAAGYWQYTDFVVGQAVGRLVACQDSHPWNAPWAWRAAACPVEACTFADVAPPNGTPVLTCSLARTGGAAPGHLAAVRYDTWNPSYPFDFTLFGDDQAGDSFCCHFNAQALTVLDVAIEGSSESDTILFRWAFGDDLGMSSGSLAALGSVPITVVTGIGQDLIVSSPFDGGGTYNVFGGAHGDRLIVPENSSVYAELGSGADVAEVHGPGTASIFGGAHADTMVATWSGSVGSSISFIGGTGSDSICSNTGPGVTVRSGMGSGPAISGTDELYLSTIAGLPSLVPPGWMDDSTNGRCGHPMHGTGWAGDCIYDPTFVTPPPACAPWIAP